MSINYGAQSYPPQNYPIYPNCFDNLTTNGIVAEDVVGYITGEPSPYLQNYVAQRGWSPSLPGRVLPDPLPTAPPPRQLPRGDVYRTVPNQDEINNYVRPQKKSKWKNIAAAVLLTGLAVFGVIKGRQLFKSGSVTTSKVGDWFKNLGKNIAKPFKGLGTKISDGLKTCWTKTCDFFKDMWNKLFKKKPAP